MRRVLSWLATRSSCVHPIHTSVRYFIRFSAPLRAARFLFDLSALPPALQDEFDPAANERGLQYLSTHRRRNGIATSAASASASEATSEDTPIFITVPPAWVHRVVWRCSRCGGSWSARPAERTDPQVRDQHSCPHCAQAPCTARSEALEAPSSATSTTNCTEEKNCTPPFSQGKEDAYEQTAVVASGQASLLVKAYPTLAAQWDVTRNTHPQNRVGTALADVSTASAAKVWWRCSLCETPWRESVASRVVRHEAAAAAARGPSTGETAHDKDDSKNVLAAATFLSLCPACERRGAMDRLNPLPRGSRRAPPLPPPQLKMTLSQDPLLLVEARLRPHQNPAEISLHSETILTWECRTCAYEFQASVAGRHDRHERCPQCSGRVETPLNLLVIQRPDVVREVSKAISRTRLCHLTVQNDTCEIPFVCRTCLSPYRMTARARCAVPQGVPACPKCALVLSQTIAAAPAPASRHALSAAKRRSTIGGTRGVTSRSRKEQRQICEAARRLSASGWNGEHMAATKNDLVKRDKMLRN